MKNGIRIFLLNIALLLPIQSYSNESTCYESYPSDCCSGECYYGCRSTCQLAAGIAIGVIIFTGMIIAVVNNGNGSHSH